VSGARFVLVAGLGCELAWWKLDTGTKSENLLQGTSVRDRSGKPNTGYFCQGLNWKVGYRLLLSGTETENGLQSTFSRDRIATLVTGYFCQGPKRKTGYGVFPSGTEPEHWLHGTSVRDRTGKLVTGYFCQGPNPKLSFLLSYCWLNEGSTVSLWNSVTLNKPRLLTELKINVLIYQVIVMNQESQIKLSLPQHSEAEWFHQGPVS